MMGDLEVPQTLSEGPTLPEFGLSVTDFPSCHFHDERFPVGMPEAAAGFQGCVVCLSVSACLCCVSVCLCVSVCV